MTKIEPLQIKNSFASSVLNVDGSITSEVNGKGKKSKLKITRDGIELAVIVGDVVIDSVELEGNTKLTIKD